MKSKKFSLKNVNDEAADKISESYPAEWNMDKVFNASYKKFLASEKNEDVNVNSNVDAADDKLELCSVETVPKKSRIAVFTFRKTAAVAFAVMVALMLRTLYVMPDNIRDSLEDIDKLPIITNDRNDLSETDTFPVTSAVYEESSQVSTSAASGNVPAEPVTTKAVSNLDQVISSGVPATSTVYKESDSVTTSAASSGRVPVTGDVHKYPGTISTSAAPSEIVPVTGDVHKYPGAISTSTAPSEIVPVTGDVHKYPGAISTSTDPSEIVSVTSGVYKEPITVSTSAVSSEIIHTGAVTTKVVSNQDHEIPTTDENNMNDAPDIAFPVTPVKPPSPVTNVNDKNENPSTNVDHDYFKYTVYKSDKWDTLQYIRNNNKTVAQHEHTFALDGFDFKVNREDTFTKEITVKEIENNQTYSLTMNSYESFIVSLNPKFERIKTELKINGRPGYFIRYADDKMKICMLYWDDGCHICSLVSTIDNYDSMLFIAKNLK